MIQSVSLVVTPGYTFPPNTAYTPDDLRAGATPTVSGTLSHTPAAISGTEISWTAAKVFHKTLTGNTTFTFAGTTEGYEIEVVLYSGAGGFTVTWPTVKWVAATAPTMTATAARWDIYRFRYYNSILFGEVVAQNMS